MDNPNYEHFHYLDFLLEANRPTKAVTSMEYHSCIFTYLGCKTVQVTETCQNIHRKLKTKQNGSHAVVTLSSPYDEKIG